MDIEAFLRCIGQAEATWPGVVVPPEEFRAYLAARAKAGLAGLYTDELYLCCAVLRHDATALAILERHYLQKLMGVCLRIGLSRTESEDMLQKIRSHVIVGDAARGPRLASYSGTGPLLGWLSVTTARAARRHLKSVEHEPARSEDIFDHLAGDPELAYLKLRYREICRQAIHDAVAALPPRGQTLLRYQLVDGLTADQIARVYHVHRVSVHRWLADLRSSLLESVQARLKEELRASADDVDSILRLVRSQLDVSLHRLLKDVLPEVPKTQVK